MFDFDKDHSRVPGNCKWDGMGDCIPLSVADMDFQSPQPVIEALQRRVEKGLFGYQVLTERDYEAVMNWRKQRHGEEIPREHLLATPGVLNTMRAAIYALTAPGDGVIVQTPLHTPSITSASMRGRHCVDVPMLCDEAGRYTMDYAGLERAFQAGNKVLALCSPSNPTGRVWTGEELERLAALVRKYDAYVVADEIHADIVYAGFRHIPLHTLPGMEGRVITVFSPSKSFNFGGIHIASAVIADGALRKKISDILYEAGICCGRPDALAITAQTAAYEQGGSWLDALLSYLEGNIAFVQEALRGTPLRVRHPEASILLWVDCSDLSWDTRTYMQKMETAGILPDPGHYYFMDNHAIGSYIGMQSHFRINIATHRENLAEAIRRLKTCF